MPAATIIAAKDLRLRLRDRSAIIVGVLAPLGLAFIFNAVLGNVVEGEFVPSFSVTDLDGSAVTASFVDVLEQIDREGVIDIAERPSTVEAAESLAEAGTVSAAIVIEEGFGDAVESGEAAAVTVIANPDNPLSAEIARSIAEGFAAEVRASQLAVATAVAASATAPTPEEIARLAAAASAGLPNPITVGTVDAATRQLDLPTFFAASMAVFFLFFTVSFGVNGLLEERQQGTIARLLVAPIKARSIVTAKAIVSYALGVVAMTILIVASSLLLGADWGDPLGVAILVVVGVAAATGLMMLVASFARTPEQAGNLMAILAVGLGMLGGIFFPASLGTGVLSYVAYISPHRWFLLGLSDLAGGGGLSVIVPSILGLLGFAAVGWGVAAARLSRGIAL